MRRQLISFISIATCSGINVLGAADWPGFRGPDAQGHSPATGLVTTWSDTEHIRWKTRLPGPGSSSPIVRGDRVFVTCYSGYGVDKDRPGDPAKLKRHLLCVSAMTGKVLWDRAVAGVLPEVPSRGRILEHGYASHTPVTDGQRIYAFFGKSGVVAFGLQGQKIWQRSVGTGSHRLKWGSASSVTLHKNLLFVNAYDESKTLYALKQDDGQIAWQQDLSGAGLSFATPVLGHLPDGSSELVMALPTQVWGLNPETGQKLWWITTTMKGIVTGTPLAYKGRAYVHGGGPGGLSSLAVHLGGRGDVTRSHVRWSGASAASVPSPAPCNGLLYWVTNDGKACCQDPQTGRLKYSQALPVTGRFAVYASVLSAENRIYAVTRKEGTFVLSVGPDFQVISQNRFSSDSSDFNGSPAIGSDCMFIRSNRYLYCIGG